MKTQNENEEKLFNTQSTTDTRYCLEHDQIQTKWMGLSFVPTKRKKEKIFQNKSNY